MPSARRAVLVGLVSPGLTLIAGCSGNENQQNDDENAGTTDTDDCDPAGDIEVYPAITVPDGESTRDAEANGLVEVAAIERVLEQAYDADSEEFRDTIDPAQQTHFDNRLATTASGTDPDDIGVDAEKVAEYIEVGENFVHYRDREYVLVYTIAVC